MDTPTHYPTPGMIVRILFPAYAVGEMGEIVAPEPETDNWLVQVLGKDMLLALLPTEFVVMQSDGIHQTA